MEHSECVTVVVKDPLSRSDNMTVKEKSGQNGPLTHRGRDFKGHWLVGV